MSDAPPPDDFDPYKYDMNINSIDVPKSTVAVALLLWGVLAGIGAWSLTLLSEMRTEQGKQGVMIANQDARIDGIERRVDRNEGDIRDLQRTRK